MRHSAQLQNNVSRKNKSKCNCEGTEQLQENQKKAKMEEIDDESD